MLKYELKNIVKNYAVLSKSIDNTYQDKRFVKLGRINDLIDSELNENVKHSSDFQRDSFAKQLKESSKTVKNINELESIPDLYVDLYIVEIISICVVSSIDHMKLINSLINDQRIDIFYHNW